MQFWSYSSLKVNDIVSQVIFSFWLTFQKGSPQTFWNTHILVIFLVPGSRGRKTPDAQNLKDERCVWAHGFRGSSPWSAGSKEGTSSWRGIAKRSCPLRGSWQAEHRANSQGQIYSLQGHTSVTYPGSLRNVL